MKLRTNDDSKVYQFAKMTPAEIITGIMIFGSMKFKEIRLVQLQFAKSDIRTNDESER